MAENKASAAVVFSYPLSFDNKEIVRRFLNQQSFTRKEYDYSYPKWATGGRGWDRTFCSGGTDTMNALMWYHHRHRPRSKEWRPTVIMDAVCAAAGVNQ